MSTSRKLMVKLDIHSKHFPKHRHAARKGYSIEAASFPTEAFHRRDAGQDPEENGYLPLHAQRYSACLLLSLAVGPKLFAGLSWFTCIFQSRSLTSPAHRARQRQELLTHRAASLRHRNIPRALPEQVLLKILLFVCQIPPLKFGQTFTFFIPQGVVPRKPSAKPKCDMRATVKGPATILLHTPPDSGKSWKLPASSPSGVIRWIRP